MAQEISKKFTLKVPNKRPKESGPIFTDQASLQKPALEKHPGTEDEVIDMSDVDEFHPDQDTDYITKTAYFTDARHDPPKKLPIPLRWSPYLVYKRILDHNFYGNYTGVTMIGMSGSGKTTLTRAFTHYLHRQAEKGGIE